MTLSPLHSLTVLVIAGFSLVALPLISAIFISSTFVDRLAANSTAVVARSTEAARSSQMLTNQLLTLERNARQYQILEDPKLKTVYTQRHNELMALIDRLGERIPDPMVQNLLNDLAQQSSTLFDRVTESGVTQEQQSQEFKTLYDLAGRTVDAVNAWIAQQLDAMDSGAGLIKQQMMWQIVAVIPVAIGLAVLFTVLINRSIRGLGDAIRQLGRGAFETPIHVRGPHDLELLGKHLDWLRRRLLELENEKNQFLRHISHELKSPLANLREGIELLDDGSVGTISAVQREVTDILQENSLLLQERIEGLLNFNAWRHQKNQPRLEQCELALLLRDIVNRHQLQLARGEVSVETDLQVQHVDADREQLHVMLDNLISNAIKYSPAGGRIFVASAPDGRHINIDVSDEGPGVPEADHQRVFNAFFQGEQCGSGHLRGTGIGLAVVRECARAHGGSVFILNGRYPGAHFRIQLPGEGVRHEI